MPGRYGHEEKMLIITMVNLRYNYLQIARATGRTPTAIFAKVREWHQDFPEHFSLPPPPHWTAIKKPVTSVYAKFIHGLTLLRKADDTSYYKDEANGKYYGFKNDMFFVCDGSECPNCHHHIPVNGEVEGFCSEKCHEETLEAMRRAMGWYEPIVIEKRAKPPERERVFIDNPQPRRPRYNGR